MPYTMFVDGFALWGKGNKSFYSMLGAYTTMGNIPIHARHTQNAQHVTNLSEMGANAVQAAEVLTGDMRKLFFGVEFNNESTGEDFILHCNALAFIGDMPQQALNAGVKRHTNKRSCRE